MNIDLVKNLILFVTFVSSIPQNKAEKYIRISLSFNETCDESSNLFCDISVGLICGENSRCACINGVTTFFDWQTGNCVRRASAVCGEFTGIGNIADIPCTFGAECVIEPYIHDKSEQLSPICKCSDGYTINNEGKCTAVSLQPPSCSSNDQCGTGMTCIGNTCVCVDQEDMIYDEISQSCKSLVDTACFLRPIGGVIKDCVDNADCIADNPLVGYCKCREGFDPDGNKLCVWDGISPTGTAPSTVATSRQTFTSTTEIIATDTTTQVTTTTTPNPGLGLIGQPCELEENISKNMTQMEEANNGHEGKQSSRILKCVPNAFCSMGKCACQKGYSPESAKKCVPSGESSLLLPTPLLIICIKIVYRFL